MYHTIISVSLSMPFCQSYYTNFQLIHTVILHNCTTASGADIINLSHVNYQKWFVTRAFSNCRVSLTCIWARLLNLQVHGASQFDAVEPILQITIQWYGKPASGAKCDTLRCHHLISRIFDFDVNGKDLRVVWLYDINMKFISLYFYFLSIKPIYRQICKGVIDFQEKNIKLDTVSVQSKDFKNSYRKLDTSMYISYTQLYQL